MACTADPVEVRVLYCSSPDCLRRAVRNGLCETHRKRRRKGRSMSAPVREVQSSYERILAAGVEHLDSFDRKAYVRAAEKSARQLHAEAVAAFRAHLRAESDEDYQRTRVRFRAAARAWLQVRALPDYSATELLSEMRRRGLPCARCRRQICRTSRS